VLDSNERLTSDLAKAKEEASRHGKQHILDGGPDRNELEAMAERVRALIGQWEEQQEVRKRGGLFLSFILGARLEIHLFGNFIKGKPERNPLFFWGWKRTGMTKMRPSFFQGLRVCHSKEKEELEQMTAKYRELKKKVKRRDQRLHAHYRGEVRGHAVKINHSIGIVMKILLNN